MIQLVTRVLQAMAATLPGFPSAEIKLRRIRQLLGLMQVRAAVEPVAEKAVVDRFLSEAVQPCPGARLLSEELRGAFALSCQAKGLPLCSEDLFFKVVSKKLGPASLNNLISSTVLPANGLGEAKRYTDTLTSVAF